MSNIEEFKEVSKINNYNEWLLVWNYWVGRSNLLNYDLNVKNKHKFSVDILNIKKDDFEKISNYLNDLKERGKELKSLKRKQAAKKRAEMLAEIKSKEEEKKQKILLEFEEQNNLKAQQKIMIDEIKEEIKAKENEIKPELKLLEKQLAKLEKEVRQIKQKIEKTKQNSLGKLKTKLNNLEKLYNKPIKTSCRHDGKRITIYHCWDYDIYRCDICNQEIKQENDNAYG